VAEPAAETADVTVSPGDHEWCHAAEVPLLWSQSPEGTMFAASRGRAHAMHTHRHPLHQLEVATPDGSGYTTR
jgi:hypothetical protein